MKIDIFPHILPMKYVEELKKRRKANAFLIDLSYSRPLTDINVRAGYMDRHPDVLQVLTMALPPLESVLVTPADAIELARIANDEMAEILNKYPQRFIAAVACLPMNDIEAALKETERAITKLGFKGIQIFTNIDGEQIGEPRFRTLYELMAKYDLPIWIHPWNPPISKDYVKDIPNLPETLQKQLFYRFIDRTTGGYIWPFETALAMKSLAFSGIFEEFPDIKFITHHCGGMVPFFERRIQALLGGQSANLRKFYNDTAVYGSTPALMCGYAFCGADHLVFGTDWPLGGGSTPGPMEETIRSVEGMDILPADKDKIFYKNAARLLKINP